MMHRSLKLLSITLGLAWGLLAAANSTAWSQPPAATEGRVPELLTQNVRDFLDDVAAGDVQSGYEQLVLGGPLEKALDESSLVEKTLELPKKFGPSRDFHLVQARPVGENLVILKYLHEFEEFPVLWHITYYRRGPQPREEDWVVVTVRFDTNFESLLGQPQAQP